MCMCAPGHEILNACVTVVWGSSEGPDVCPAGRYAQSLKVCDQAPECAKSFVSSGIQEGVRRWDLTCVQSPLVVELVEIISKIFTALDQSTQHMSHNLQTASLSYLHYHSMTERCCICRGFICRTMPDVAQEVKKVTDHHNEPKFLMNDVWFWCVLQDKLTFNDIQYSMTYYNKPFKSVTCIAQPVCQ